MDDLVRQLIFEACNDAMCAGMPMTGAMHNAMMLSTGDRGKYPSALDSLARMALEEPNAGVKAAAEGSPATEGSEP